MSDARDLVAEAARLVTEVVRGATGADLSARTPCREFDLASLVNHMTGTTGALAGVGEGKPLDPGDPWGSRTVVADGDWQTVLSANLARIGAAWSRPQAWDGTVAMGDGEMPASAIGDMAFIEVLVHGWDLARATGQGLSVPDRIGAELHRAVAETADLGRQMGAYGESVHVPESATDVALALGAAGRDPGWSSGPGSD